jgi:hypothetical protein
MGRSANVDDGAVGAEAQAARHRLKLQLHIHSRRIIAAIIPGG